MFYIIDKDEKNKKIIRDYGTYSPYDAVIGLYAIDNMIYIKFQDDDWAIFEKTESGVPYYEDIWKSWK